MGQKELNRLGKRERTGVGFGGTPPGRARGCLRRAQRNPDGFEKFPGRERFRKQRGDLKLRLVAEYFVGVRTRGDNDRESESVGANPLNQLPARQARHIQIRHEQVITLAVKRFPRFGAIGGSFHLVPSLGERGGEDAKHAFVIVR